MPGLDGEPLAGVLRAERERGVGRVAIKLGREGAFAMDDETSEWVAPSPVDTRDETGAGDAFAAGLIHGLLEGLPLARAVRLGNAVGALPDGGEAFAL